MGSPRKAPTRPERLKAFDTLFRLEPLGGARFAVSFSEAVRKRYGRSQRFLTMVLDFVEPRVSGDLRLIFENKTINHTAPSGRPCFIFSSRPRRIKE